MWPLSQTVAHRTAQRRIMPSLTRMFQTLRMAGTNALGGDFAKARPDIKRGISGQILVDGQAHTGKPGLNKHPCQTRQADRALHGMQLTHQWRCQQKPTTTSQAIQSSHKRPMSQPGLRTSAGKVSPCANQRPIRLTKHRRRLPLDFRKNGPSLRPGQPNCAGCVVTLIMIYSERLNEETSLRATRAHDLPQRKKHLRLK